VGLFGDGSMGGRGRLASRKRTPSTITPMVAAVSARTSTKMIIDFIDAPLAGAPIRGACSMINQPRIWGRNVYRRELWKTMN
jgi:hypothetical protein